MSSTIYRNSSLLKKASLLMLPFAGNVHSMNVSYLAAMTEAPESFRGTDAGLFEMEGVSSSCVVPPSDDTKAGRRTKTKLVLLIASIGVIVLGAFYYFYRKFIKKKGGKSKKNKRR